MIGLAIPNNDDAKTLAALTLVGLYCLITVLTLALQLPASETLFVTTAGLIVSLLVGGATAEVFRQRSVRNSQAPRRDRPPADAGRPQQQEPDRSQSKEGGNR